MLACKSSWEAREVAAGIGAPQRHALVPVTGNITAASGRNSSHGSDQWLGRGLLTSTATIQPVTPKYFPPSGDKGKEGSLALVKCGADSFTASLGRGAERKSVRFNLC